MKRLLAVLSAWKLATVVLWARYCRSEVPPLTDRFRWVSSIGQRNTYLDMRVWSDDDEARISQDEGFGG